MLADSPVTDSVLQKSNKAEQEIRGSRSVALMACDVLQICIELDSVSEDFAASIFKRRKLGRKNGYCTVYFNRPATPFPVPTPFPYNMRTRFVALLIFLLVGQRKQVFFSESWHSVTCIHDVPQKTGLFKAG
jgi:hypothetical protein